jgi:hypothetical protein
MLRTCAIIALSVVALARQNLPLSQISYITFDIPQSPVNHFQLFLKR